MKALFKAADPGNNTKFIAIVGSKRHHIRFFPEKGDKNGNALPGTLVESGVTNPFENDFFPCGHNALKGTARPVHYYVLLNETTMGNDFVHTLLYEILPETFRHCCKRCARSVVESRWKVVSSCLTLCRKS